MSNQKWNSLTESQMPLGKWVLAIVKYDNMDELTIEYVRRVSNDEYSVKFDGYHVRPISQIKFWKDEELPKTTAISNEPMATNRELAEWLAKGNGQILRDNMVWISWAYSPEKDNVPVSQDIKIRWFNTDSWIIATKKNIYTIPTVPPVMSGIIRKD